MKIIFIDPGHSTKDPGAVGYETEFKLAEAVSKHQAAYLQEHYVCEPYVCPSDIDSLRTIYTMANDMGAALYVSNHFNASKGDGYEALVYSQARVELGKIFAKHVKAAGQNLRSSSVAPGVKIRADLSVLRYTNMPAIVNEGAFVDNLKDIQDWNEDHELKKLGEAYAKAAAEFLGLEEKVQETEQAQVYVTLDVLRKGSSGEQVKALQRNLYAMGYYKSTIDGEFGSLTEAAVKAFQKAAGLTPDGIVGLQTWNRLLGME